jgi:hypothetical protein
MLTDGATVGSMVMVIAADVSIAGDAQAADEVMIQETTCPLVRALVV